MDIYDDFIQSLREQRDDMLAQIDWLHSVGVTVYINGEDVTELTYNRGLKGEHVTGTREQSL